MSEATIPDRPKCVKTGRKRTAVPYAPATTEPERVAADAARASRDPEGEAAAANLRAWSTIAKRIYKPGRDEGPLYSLALCSTHTGGRRFRPRTAGLVLSPRERERCRQQIARASACGTAFSAFRRYVPTESGIREDRMVCQQKCGTRTCDECERAIRKRECWRVEGPWRQFYTLGCPPRGRSHQECWRVIAAARDKLWKRLERELALGNGRVIRVSEESAAAARAHRATVPRARVRRSPLDYAWTLEPHESGYPHLHFVANTEFVNWRWLKKVWGELVGASIEWMKCVEVFDADGTCRYLSKYISKTTFPPDLLALLYRQRMWATTRPLPKKALGEWLRERDTNEAMAAAQAGRPEDWGSEPGFRLQQSSRGRYAIWSRYFALEDGIDAWLFLRFTKHRWDQERQASRRTFRARGGPPNTAALEMALQLQ